MSICDGLRLHIFRQKMEKARSVKEKVDEKVFISRKTWHFYFKDNVFEVLFPICTLTWFLNNYVLRHRKRIDERNEGTTILESYYHFKCSVDCQY